MKEISYIDQDGSEWHWFNDSLHREDGPAVMYANGDFAWYKHGKRHRLDGPAMYYNKCASWCVEGKKIDVKNQKEFEQYLKLIAFI
jgi:hypothetical protein